MPDEALVDEMSVEPDPSVSPCRLERKPNGDLVAHIPGQDEPVEDARVARCFPWSVPECYVSIRSKEGKEIAMVRDLGQLDEPTRQIVLEELADKVFNPRILKVTSFKREFDVTRITAQTDRGEVTFQIRTRDDVRVLSQTRALFRDVDGNTYEVADLHQLDPASQKHLGDFF